jgi:hypothetical protein
MRGKTGRVAARVAVIVIGLSELSGCASATSQEDSEIRRWAREIRILEPGNLGDRRYDVLAELEERVRIGPLGEEDARAEAERSMRLRAARIDADAVVLADCGRVTDSDDWEARTTLILRCVGYAIRWSGL